MAERIATAIASGTTLPAGFSLGDRAGSESLRTELEPHQLGHNAARSRVQGPPVSTSVLSLRANRG